MTRTFDYTHFVLTGNERRNVLIRGITDGRVLQRRHNIIWNLQPNTFGDYYFGILLFGRPLYSLDSISNFPREMIGTSCEIKHIRWAHSPQCLTTTDLRCIESKNTSSWNYLNSHFLHLIVNSHLRHAEAEAYDWWWGVRKTFRLSECSVAKEAELKWWNRSNKHARKIYHFSFFLRMNKVRKRESWNYSNLSSVANIGFFNG